MTLKHLIISLLAIQFLTACGGGGGDSENNTISQLSHEGGVLVRDLDDLPDDGSVGQLALSSQEVENSLCFAELPSFREINQDYFSRALVQPIENFRFNYVLEQNEFGVSETQLTFNGQNREIYEIMSALLFNVKQPSVTGHPPVFGVSNNKPIYHDVRSFCNDIQCTAESVFGESWGLRFLFKDKFGIVLSGHVDPNTEEYSNDQYLYSVAQAILSMPKGTFPLNKNNFIPSMQELSAENVIIAPYLTGYIPTEKARGAAGVAISSRSGATNSFSLLSNVDVYLLDPWKQIRDFHDRLYTVFHELIHVLDQAKEEGKILSETNDWLQISDWRFDSRTETWVMVKDNLKCSDYGSSIPQEDFAECGSLYRFAPNRLRRISRAKYDFFKNRVFNGVEYNEISKCRRNVETF